MINTIELVQSPNPINNGVRARFLSFPSSNDISMVDAFTGMNASAQKAYLTEHHLSPWTPQEFHNRLISYGSAVTLTYPDTPTPYDYFQMHTQPITIFEKPHIRLGTFGFSEGAIQTKRKAAGIKLATWALEEAHPQTALWIEVLGEPTKFEQVLVQSGFSPSPDPELVENLLDVSGIEATRVWRKEGVTYHATPGKDFPQKVLIFDKEDK